MYIYKCIYIYIYITSGSCRPFNEKVDKILHSLPNFISGPFCNISPRHVYIYGVSTSSPTHYLDLLMRQLTKLNLSPELCLSIIPRQSKARQGRARQGKARQSKSDSIILTVVLSQFKM